MWPEMKICDAGRPIYRELTSVSHFQIKSKSDFYLCRHLEYFDLAAGTHLPAHQPVEGWQADVLNLDKIKH